MGAFFLFLPILQNLKFPLMKQFSLLFLLFVFILSTQAQKQELKLSDPYQNPEVYPERISQLQWLADENAYSFVEDSLWMVAPAGKKAKSLFTLSQFNEHLKQAGKQGVPRFPNLRWKSGDEFTFVRQDTIYLYNWKSGLVKMLNVFKSQSEYIKTHDKSGDVAFTEGQNLFIYSNGNKTQVTNDLKPGVVNGQTVARSEFGITHGIFWSPSGRLLAYYHKDESMVSDYPLVNVNTRVAEVEGTRYPMAGMTSEQVQVCVYNLDLQKTVCLKTGEPAEQYLTNVTWSPDDQYIYIAVLNRGQNHMKLNQYDAATGAFMKTLFEEKSDKYVEPQEGLHFLNNNNDEFIWMSRRDGWNHAYLYNTKGEMLKQVTKGDWEITEFLGFDAANKLMYFMGTKESPIESHLYSVELASGKINKLTQDHGSHNVMLSYDKKYFIDIYSNYNKVTRKYTLNSTKGKEIKTLLDSKNPLENFNVGEMSISTLKAKDGTDLYYRLIKPVDFDPAKKYPVIVYVYGGPHAQLVNDTWLGGGGFFLQYLATQGYVVFTLDNRGSAHRGMAFESIIHRQLGKTEMEDQMVGIDFLKSKPWVDQERIGVHGWSFGGFMTTSLMTHHSDVFKVGVAGGPVIDWKYYEIMYGERYMDTPEENPDGYKASSLLPKAKDLNGKLLIIHGAMDPTVVWQHSLQFLNACIKTGKQVDYFVYPNHEHNVRGYDRLHLETKIYNYFKDYL